MWKLRTKLGVIFAVFFAEILVIIFAFLYISSRYVEYVHEFRGEIEEQNLIDDARLALAQIVMPVNDSLIAGADPNEYKNFKAACQKIEGLFAELEGSHFGSLTEKEIFFHLKAEYARGKKIAENIFAMPDRIGNPAAGKMMEEMDALIYSAVADANRFRQFARDEIEEASEEWDRTKEVATLVIICGVIFNILLIAASLFFLERVVVQPIRFFSGTVEEIVDKGVFHELIYEAEYAEMAQLGTALNKMINEFGECRKKLQTKTEQFETLSREIEEKPQSPAEGEE